MRIRQIKKRLKISLLNLLYRRLWIKIAFVLCLIVTILVALLGILLIHTSQKAVRNSVLNNHREIAARAAVEIELFMKKSQDILATTAQILSIVHLDPWKQETILVELALNQPVFMRLSSVDSAGHRIAGSELGSQLKQDYLNDALQEALAGKRYISKVKILGSHTPYVTMSVPVEEKGKIAGALIADVKLRGLWKIVDTIRLDKTGRAFLVSNDGTLIAHQDKKMVLKNENIKDQRDVQSVLAGRTDAIELYDMQGKKWVSSFAAIPNLGWGIVLRQEQAEAYSFSEVMKMQSWIIIILSELIVIVASVIIANILAKPIKVLVSRIKRAAAGDLDDTIEIVRHDEIGELIRSFNTMIKKLKKAKTRERLSAIGEVTAWITHEFKNSLLSIKSFVQMFPDKHMDKKFVDTFSKLIPQEIERWERMLKELSDFSSHHELQMVTTNVKEILSDILEIMQVELIKKKIIVEYTDQGDSLYLVADPERLKQVFMNLIINAVEAMPEGGLLTVSMDVIDGPLLGKPSYIEVRIEDTGVGIPHGLLGRIFDPFCSSREGGMGLGLTISRRIIEQHGGYINVESQIDKGTTFIARFPIANRMQTVYKP